MKFTALLVGSALLLWGVTYTPIHFYLGREHWRGFFFGSVLSLTSVLLSYFTFQIFQRFTSHGEITGALLGPLIRFGIILAGLIIAAITNSFDIKILAVWTLFFYFVLLSIEITHLVKQVSSQSNQT